MKKEKKDNAIDWKVGFNLGVVTVVGLLAFYLKDKIIILDNEI